MTKKSDGISDNIAALKTKAADEPVASFLNMRLVELSDGHARVAMDMIADHVNFNGLIFGGIIMALADEAFAYATNTIVTPNVATQFNIHFIAGAQVGDTLTAECNVIKSGKRVCVSEITVINQDSKLIAKATGTTIPIVQGT
jgi:acyl-CoA thioesterase